MNLKEEILLSSGNIKKEKFTLNEATFNKEEILKEAKKVIKEKPELRFGQTVFNLAYKKFPEQTNKLRSGKKDCFHNDKNITDFLNELEQLVNKE